MGTKYSKLSENEDLILVQLFSKNENDKSFNTKGSLFSENQYNVQNELLYSSMEAKLRAQRTRPKFQVLQKWEGIVEKVEGDKFQVRLIDLTNGGTDEEAELDFQDISTDDIELVKEGAMFYWSIGYETQLDRQRKKTSFIKFKRLPQIDVNQFDSIFNKAEELKNKISFE